MHVRDRKDILLVGCHLKEVNMQNRLDSASEYVTLTSSELGREVERLLNLLTKFTFAKLLVVSM